MTGRLRFLIALAIAGTVSPSIFGFSLGSASDIVIAVLAVHLPLALICSVIFLRFWLVDNSDGHK